MALVPKHCWLILRSTYGFGITKKDDNHKKLACLSSYYGWYCFLFVQNSIAFLAQSGLQQFSWFTNLQQFSIFFPLRSRRGWLVVIAQWRQDYDERYLVWYWDYPWHALPIDTEVSCQLLIYIYCLSLIPCKKFPKWGMGLGSHNQWGDQPLYFSSI